MAKRKRKAIPDSVRFEVFKRDSFKCQYCGRCAPEVVLVVDHIDPLAKGGGNEIVNLISACWDCNSGKSDRRLNDTTILAKQRAQLEELADRRAQIEMMLSWRKGLAAIEVDEVEVFAQEFHRRSGWGLTPPSRDEARKMIGKFTLAKCLDGIKRACDEYVKFEDVEGHRQATRESATRAWRSAWIFSQPPDLQVAYLVRAIVRNQLTDVGKWRPAMNWQAIDTIKRAIAEGVPPESVKSATLALHPIRSFSGWQDAIDSLAAEAQVAGRIRSIKPEILDDEVVAALPHIEFRLFVSMFVMADDYGNLGGVAARVKGTALWGVPDSVDKVKAALEHMAEVGLIEIYRVRGQAFIHLRGWSKHQKVDKPGRPIYPGPDQADSSGYDDSSGSREDSRGSREDSRGSTDGLATDQDHDQRPTTGTNDGTEPRPARKPKGPRPRVHAPAVDPEPTPADRAYAAERSIDVVVEWPAMFDNHRKRAEPSADWSASWRTWCRNAVKFREERQSRAGPSPRRVTGMTAALAASDLFDRMHPPDDPASS